MPLKNIKQILKDAMGLHADSIGDSSVQRAVEHRMVAISIASMEKYLAFVLNDSNELMELIEEVIVPETWFFRNINAFNSLRLFVLDKLAKGKDGTFRVLSIPCSTGEEAYSVAMTLIEAGLTEDMFHVDAIDISQRSLKKAKRGIFGKHSFREEGVTDYWQMKYFSKSAAGYKIDNRVKSCVSFRQGNLLSANLDLIESSYDVIFCRNLLIYFDREMQKAAIDKIYSALKEGGGLFIGHGETSQMDEQKFQRLPYPKAFAYIKSSANVTGRYVEGKDVLALLSEAYNKLEASITSGKTLPEPGVHNISAVKEKGKNAVGVSSVSSAMSSVSSIANLEEALQKGELEKADRLCQQYLEVHTESAEAHYYQGLAHYLLGRNASAEEFLKKSLYLDPDNYRALGLLALLAEKKGDTNSAESYRRREARVLKRKPHIQGSGSL